MHICTLTHMHAISLCQKHTTPYTALYSTHKRVLSSAYPTVLTPKTQSIPESTLVMKTKQKHAISTPTISHSLRICQPPTCSAPPPNSHIYE